MYNFLAGRKYTVRTHGDNYCSNRNITERKVQCNQVDILNYVRVSVRDSKHILTFLLKSIAEEQFLIVIDKSFQNLLQR